MEQVQIGKIYRHFKGNYYFIEDIALDSETNEMFLEEISIERPDNITGQKYRFELQENISKDYTE